MGNDSRRSLHLAGSPTSFRSTDQGRRECAVPLVSSPGLVAVPHGVGASTSGGKVGNSVTRGRRSRGMASPLLAASLAIILAAVPCASFSPATSSLGNFKGLSVAHSSATRTSGRARGARRWREGHGAAPGWEIQQFTADTTPARWRTCGWFAGRCHPCLSNEQEGKNENLIPPALALVPFGRRLCEHGTVRVG
jgi:hypothetical protein